MTNPALTLDCVVDRVLARHPDAGRLAELLALGERDPASPARLAAIIEADPCLDARLCAAFDPREAPHLRRSGVPLDSSALAGRYRALHSIAVGLAATEVLGECIQPAADAAAFWLWTGCAAHFASTLARFEGGEVERDLAFGAAVMRSMGVALLDAYASQAARTARHHALLWNLPVMETERLLYGFTSDDLARELSRAWGLPARLAAAFALSNDPRSLGALVRRAAAFATHCGVRHPLEPALTRPPRVHEPSLDGYLRATGGIEALTARFRDVLRAGEIMAPAA